MTLLAAMLEHPVSNGIHEPKHILDLLKKAATANKGLIYLDNGISEAPITVSYAQLLQDATVRSSGHSSDNYLRRPG